MPKKILVVDDEPHIVKMVESRLKANGYEVIIAYDGQEAVEKVKSDMPDLIVLDLLLPKIDGYMVFDMLKQEEKYKNIPIVMLTARAGYEDMKKGLEIGAIAYLTKPFKAEVLLGIIAGAVGDGSVIKTAMKEKIDEAKIS